jgi:hypothetical protein
MPENLNIYQLYVKNDYKFKFYISRNSWSNEKYATVVSIDGVEEGQPIDGKPPYFTRYCPKDHPKAGKIWKRIVYLKAPWFDDGTYETDCGGTYAWTRVFPEI